MRNFLVMFLFSGFAAFSLQAKTIDCVDGSGNIKYQFNQREGGISMATYEAWTIGDQTYNSPNNEPDSPYLVDKTPGMPVVQEYHSEFDEDSKVVFKKYLKDRNNLVYEYFVSAKFWYGSEQYKNASVSFHGFLKCVDTMWVGLPIP